MEQFYIYLDKAIKEGRNLDYFCFFCRTIWSSTGVHCMTCGKCIEGFDHHCPFVNSCIGNKNHANFLNFLAISTIYTMVSIANNSWVIYKNWSLCTEFGYPNDFCNDYEASITIVSVCCVFILINLIQALPLLWQIRQQFKSVKKTKVMYHDYQDFKSIFESNALQMTIMYSGKDNIIKAESSMIEVVNTVGKSFVREPRMRGKSNARSKNDIIDLHRRNSMLE